MLAKSFLNNASFMKMSDSAKLLYVYLNTNADDDGIVEAYPYINEVLKKANSNQFCE